MYSSVNKEYLIKCDTYTEYIIMLNVILITNKIKFDTSENPQSVMVHVFVQYVVCSFLPPLLPRKIIKLVFYISIKLLI